MAVETNRNLQRERQPNIFEQAERHCRQNGAAMRWTVLIEHEEGGAVEEIGTAFELDCGQIILPPMSGAGRVLLKHDFAGGV